MAGRGGERGTVVPSLVRLRGITKTFGEGSRQVAALVGVDLDLFEGEFVAIVGASGSGKSTCATVIGCLDRPTSGRIWIAGRDVSRLDQTGRALIRRDLIGFVFQGFNLLPAATALENVMLPLHYRGAGLDERRTRALRALETVGLGARADHVPSELSGGQQQRVAIARALVTRPRLIIADEPTAALDGRTGREIVAVLRNRCRDERITALMVTHDLAHADLADRVITFADGRLVGSRCRQEVA